MHTHARPLLALLLLVSFGSSPWAQTPPTAPLNDTGQSQCYDGSAMVACDLVNAGNAAAYPSQDGRYGRDTAQAKGLLPAKTGGGAAGFDFTALDTMGNPTTPGGHHCVKDNVTGLIWSTATLSRTTWDSANTGASTYSRCGYNTGWRLPTVNELQSIVSYGTSDPAIDGTYFPGTQSDWYWTADTYAPNPTAIARGVYFFAGLTNIYFKTSVFYVRLVRSGQ